MIEIRRYTNADIPLMVEYLKEGLAQHHYASIFFDENKTRLRLEGNVINPSWFCNVVIQDGELIGALAASVVQFDFSYETMAVDHITYIREGKRSLAAITKLVRSYIAWAENRRVRQIRWGQSTGFKMDKFVVLAKRLGFEQIGTCFNMETGK